MTWKIDQVEIERARQDLRDALWRWNPSLLPGPDDVLASIDAYVGLLIARAIQDRDERGHPWP